MEVYCACGRRFSWPKKKATAINSFDLHVSFKPEFKSKDHLDAHLRSFLIGSIFKKELLAVLPSKSGLFTQVQFCPVPLCHATPSPLVV